MNAARLTRRGQGAAGDPARMAEALVEEINDPTTGLVTRDFLRAELSALRGEMTSSIAQLRGEMTSSIAQLRGETTSSIAQLESRLTWRIVTVFGIQTAMVGVLVTILFQVLR